MYTVRFKLYCDVVFRYEAPLPNSSQGSQLKLGSHFWQHSSPSFGEVTGSLGNCFLLTDSRECAIGKQWTMEDEAWWEELGHLWGCSFPVLCSLLPGHHEMSCLAVPWTCLSDALIHPRSKAMEPASHDFMVLVLPLKLWPKDPPHKQFLSEIYHNIKNPLTSVWVCNYSEKRVFPH